MKFTLASSLLIPVKVCLEWKFERRQMRDKREHRTQDVKLIAPRAEVEASFRSMVLKIKCPHCDEPFTEGAVDWGNAWLEGRMDAMRALDAMERDGPYKVKCEWCDQRSFINYFTATASKADENNSST